jgi:spore germination protein KC
MKGFITLVVFLSLILSGCYDRVELEELGHVAVIGIDKGGNGGMSVTFQISNPQVGSSEKARAENEPASEILTLDAVDIVSAKDTMSANISKRLDLSHATALILSEEFARSEECYNYIGELLRDRELRGDINVIVTKDKAASFINSNKPPMETRPTKFYDLISRRWKESGITPLANLHGFLQRTERDVSLYLAIYATAQKNEETKFGNEDEYLAGQINLESENPIQLIGSAVFKEGKMIGTLTGEETRLTMLLRTTKNLNGITGVLKDPLKEGYKVIGQLYTPKNTQIKIDLSGAKPKIRAELFVQYEIISIPSHIDYVENLENQKLLKKEITKLLEEKTQKLINKTQKEFEGEPFLWGDEVSKKFLTYKDYVDYKWMDKYSEAEVEIKYNVELKGFGKELRPSNLNRIKD